MVGVEHLEYLRKLLEALAELDLEPLIEVEHLVELLLE